MDRRRQKQKKKREEKRKLRRGRMEQQRCQEKADFFASMASEAYDDGDYSNALDHVMRAFKANPSDRSILDLALCCADASKERGHLFKLLRHAWNRGMTMRREDWLFLGELALEKGELHLALEVFRDLRAGDAPMDGRITKAQMRTIEERLGNVEQLIRLRERDEALRRCRFRPRSSSAPVKKREKAGGVGQSGGRAEGVATEPVLSPEAPGEAPGGEPGQPAGEVLPELQIDFRMEGEAILTAIAESRQMEAESLELAHKAYNLSFRTSFDQLLSLPTLNNVTSLWYQEETACKVMKTFRGQAILADEVGLGKTIEAGLVLKEYLMRGLVRTALILTPSSLIQQWKDELQEKFGLSFVTSQDALFRQRPEKFWKSSFILASIQTARSKRNFEAATARSYDIVIVDEAHHLKNRRTLNWKLVNAVKKTYLLLLTATPVQNKLEELYNLITLLRPGHLKTRKAFIQEFVSRGNPTDPRNREKLRGLLKEVMIRNTRSVTRLSLPPRFAYTVRVSPSQEEEKLYHGISELVAGQSAKDSGNLSLRSLRRLLEAAGSSHFAARGFLERIARDKGDDWGGKARELLSLEGKISVVAKMQKVLDLLQASPDKKIVFVNYRATLEYIDHVLKGRGIPHAVFQGSLSAARKQAAIDQFRLDCPILLTTGVGGEGHNLQFCHTMINYDLPWNPMEIEQRIGRIHRIGQEKEVQVYNFCSAGSIEDHILEVLDRKINMFELVIGEIDMILGRVRGEEEFGDLVYDIWIKNRDERGRRKAFNTLAGRLKRARTGYEASKKLDENLFQEDFGV